MGQRSEVYCDNCGEAIENPTLGSLVQISAVGSNGLPVLMQLCTKSESIPQTPENPLGGRTKITGCARKVLTKNVLGKLYSEVADLVGGDDPAPFVL